MIKLCWIKGKDGWSGWLWPMFQIYGYYLHGKHVRILTILEARRKPRHFPVDSVAQAKIIANKYINYGKIPLKVKELNLDKLKEGK